MKRMTALCALVGAVSLVGAISLVGCGGGGTSTVIPGASRVAVLVTDSPREDFAHVWATIYHVELTPTAGGAAVVVFDNPAGVQIDLKTLRDASGARYAFLSGADVPAGSYSGVNVTIGSTMQLIPKGATTGTPLTVDTNVARDESGNAVISVVFRTPKTVSTGTTNVCVDFDLARFVVAGSKIKPSVIEGDGAGLEDPRRHEASDHHGVVSGLTGTAPTLKFTLTTERGQTISVTTTAATALFGATFANGSAVEIEGTLDAAASTLVATSVEVRGGGDSDSDRSHGARTPRVKGTASAIDAAAGTFTLAARHCGGFAIASASVTIATSASTTFRGDGGAIVTKAVFFTALTATPNARVKGTYNAATNTLTATEARAFDALKDAPSKLGEVHRFRDEAEHGSGGDPERDHGWGRGGERSGK
jgi:hypothetical protein